MHENTVPFVLRKIIAHFLLPELEKIHPGYHLKTHGMGFCLCDQFHPSSDLSNICEISPVNFLLFANVENELLWFSVIFNENL